MTVQERQMPNVDASAGPSSPTPGLGWRRVVGAVLVALLLLIMPGPFRCTLPVVPLPSTTTSAWGAGVALSPPNSPPEPPPHVGTSAGGGGDRVPRGAVYRQPRRPKYCAPAQTSPAPDRQAGRGPARVWVCAGAEVCAGLRRFPDGR